MTLRKQGNAKEYTHQTGERNSSSQLALKEIWLLVSTPLENISQNGNLPQIGVKIKRIETTTLRFISYQKKPPPFQTSPFSIPSINASPTACAKSTEKTCYGSVDQVYLGHDWFFHIESNLKAISRLCFFPAFIYSILQPLNAYWMPLAVRTLPFRCL